MIFVLLDTLFDRAKCFPPIFLSFGNLLAVQHEQNMMENSNGAIKSNDARFVYYRLFTVDFLINYYNFGMFCMCVWY